MNTYNWRLHASLPGTSPEALGVRLWQVVGGALIGVSPSTLESEALLESLLEYNPDVLGQHLLIIGRQVQTFGDAYLDLLAIDASGIVWVIELKRNTTARAVIGQIVDYGTWVTTLTRAEIIRIFRHHRQGAQLEEVFLKHFGRALPDVLNAAHRLLIAAVSVPEVTNQNVDYLRSCGVPIEIVLFQHFKINGSTILARVMPTRNDNFISGQTGPTQPPSRTSGGSAPGNEPHGSRSRGTRVYHYRNGLYEAHSQAREFWDTHRLRFEWDFLLTDFLVALHEKWRGEERAAGRPRPALTQEVFMQRLRDIVDESGDWKYTHLSPTHLTKVTEPLAEYCGWSHDGSKASTRGLWRTRVSRKRTGETKVPKK